MVELTEFTRRDLVVGPVATTPVEAFVEVDAPPLDDRDEGPAVALADEAATAAAILLVVIGDVGGYGLDEARGLTSGVETVLLRVGRGMFDELPKSLSKLEIK